ncbi:hypothetical protein BCR36DRAFT_347135 [Piromyces finnis]|uniref:Nuclear condensin complex subunit 3 C-terminal domain-containing protein n=1 Tax=Piromyces finnis TaxID=1754191 RepID=A0A1Y1VG21_9FUNG|nr:hypothetical protein BCR36DRAFT_347135 [Piromyces finnis]|eukprot:ORX55366.1 hypothetical protein BCR36DRAFT_347135 [Piromyces finnis]
MPAPESFLEEIPNIFQDAQRSLATHRKNAAALRKIIQKHCKNEENEQLFIKEFYRNLNKILVVKKGQITADRSLKFIVEFIKFSIKKENEKKEKKKEKKLEQLKNEEQMDVDIIDVDENEEDDTFTTRFVDSLFNYLLKGISSKNKVVRYRVCQLIALSLDNLTEMDDEMYQNLTSNLRLRAIEKDANIRVHAGIALSRLLEDDEEDDNNDDDGMDEDEKEDSVMDILINMIQYDPNPDVRKAVMCNLDISTKTLPYIIERAQDTDTSIRRCFYLTAMKNISIKILSINQREKILGWGLYDREISVQKACKHLLCEKWINEDCKKDLVKFLNYFDVMTSTIIGDAIKIYFEKNQNIKMVYNENEWNSLSSEYAFLIREYVEYCHQNKKDDRLDEILPEIIKLVDYLKKYFQKIVELKQEEEDEKISNEFIVSQLLGIGNSIDYADEMGRRVMFSCLRELLVSSEIPNSQIPTIIDILMKTALNEKDLIRVIIEIICDIREPIEEVNMLKDPAMESLINTKCLEIIKCLLERTDENLSDNPALSEINHNLIVPAIKSGEEYLRELGLNCLGLWCNFDMELAVENMPLFLFNTENIKPNIQIMSLKIIFDLIMRHGFRAFEDVVINLGSQGKFTVNEIFKRCLRNTENEVLSLAVSGISKLMLLKYFYDPQILQRLVILYFHPCTAKNDSLRQCLSYFLPAFSYSSIENQEFMTGVLGVCIRKLLKQYYKNKEDMITPIQFGQQMIDWTDYRRVLSNDFYKAKSCPHARLAIKLLKIAEKDTLTVIKTVCYLLNKLTLNESVENIVIDDILERSERLKEITPNNTVNNLLTKFIFNVKNTKIKIEDDHQQNNDKSNIKIKIKDEVESPRRKSNHFIIKNNELSDNDEEKIDTFKTNLKSNIRNEKGENNNDKIDTDEDEITVDKENENNN